MLFKVLYESLQNVAIDGDYIKEIEIVYGYKIPDFLKRLLSFNDLSIYYEDLPFMRSLSKAEVLSASQDMNVDFNKLKLIPVIDLSDNDFIVFDLSEECWYMFNIVDEIKFSGTKDVLSYLNA